MNTLTCCYCVLEDKRNRRKDRQVGLCSPMLSPSPLVMSTDWDAQSLVSGCCLGIKNQPPSQFLYLLYPIPFLRSILVPPFLASGFDLHVPYTPCYLTQGKTKLIFPKQIKHFPTKSRKLDNNEHKPLPNCCSWMYFIFSHPLILVVCQSWLSVEFYLIWALSQRTWILSEKNQHVHRN